jgi:hypothetical protein
MHFLYIHYIIGLHTALPSSITIHYYGTEFPSVWLTPSTVYVQYFGKDPFKFNGCRSQWPRRLRRRSSAARLLRFWVRIPLGAGIFFCCECCVLSGRGLCDGLITRQGESYRLLCVVVCDQETSINEEAKAR